MTCMKRFTLIIIAFTIIMLVYFNLHHIKKFVKFSYFEVITMYDQNESPEMKYLSNINATLKYNENKKIRILIYTKFFDKEIWPYFKPQKNYMKGCGFQFKNCELTYDTSKFYTSDIVFFHARNMPTIYDLRNLKRKVKKRKQFWLYFNLENPLNSPSIAPIDKYFELVGGYRYNSDFHFPYGYYEKLSYAEQQTAKKSKINYAQGKTKQIAWLVSHCGALCVKLVRRFIQMGLQIDVGGGCARRYKTKLNCKDRECRETLKQYKFYFSAENNLCDEYISEKYWATAFDYNMIPIVLGGSNYSDPKMAIPGSYINALDFYSPKELVDYIKQVDSNDTLYNQYFEWRKTYEYTHEYTGCSKRLDDFCIKLHDGIPLRKHALRASINAYNECHEKEIFYHKWVNSRGDATSSEVRGLRKICP